MLFNNFIFFAILIISMLGMLIIASHTNYFYKIIGLSIIQNSIIIFYLAISNVQKSVPPVNQLQLIDGIQYVAPLPHVLMLTAVVVGFSVTSVALCLLYIIHNKFDSVDENIIKNNIKIS